MRPKFVATIVLLSALIITAAAWLKKWPTLTSATTASNETATHALAQNPNSIAVDRTTTAMVSKPSPEQEHAAVEAEIERLREFSVNHDPAALPEILGALKSPDKEIRAAAIEATMQTGDSNAIPALKEAAELVNDLEEKISFLGAIEFLSVPPLAFDTNSIPSTPEQIAAAESRRALRRAEIEREEREAHSRRSSVADSVSAASTAR